MDNELQEHRNCLFCGDLHPNSLGLRFLKQDDGSVRTHYTCSDIFQGYDGILHGGIIASLLDSAMTNCLFLTGVRAMTADLKVRYRHPVPTDAALEISAELTERCSPLYRLKAVLTHNKRIMASAEARFMESENEWSLE